MYTERPTFSESWYRVAGLKPKLHAATNVQRQFFRGLRWYTVQDPVSGGHFRVGGAAYQFIALLDGRRTVQCVWERCLEQSGDSAPTQGEVIQLLSQLHKANLLHVNLAPDVEVLFARHRKEGWRRARSTLSNFLFVRIPLWDPDAFLERWVGIAGRVFSPAGLVGWFALFLTGLVSVASHAERLMASANTVLDPDNLPWLYAAMLIVKMTHELGHAFSCKHFGRKTGTGGEVHQMGLALLFFTPLPFVDASSSWELPNKWYRILVGASGVLAELALAAIAAVIWTRTADGSVVHSVSYNTMLVASISCLAFNGNPFLRYDAYYVLLDFLEIPNLESRSKLYVGYLLKRYGWGVDQAFDPSHTAGEKGWLVFYALASSLCRILILGAIIFLLMDWFFSIGILLASILIVRWALLPMMNLVRYLLIDRELTRNRFRAILTTVFTFALIFVTIGLVKMPDRCRIEGVVEPIEYAVIHMKSTGFVRSILPSGSTIGPQSPALLVATNPELEVNRDQLTAEKKQLFLQRHSAQIRETADVQIIDEKIAALEEKIERSVQDLASLTVFTPLSGVWISPEADRLRGMRMERGRRLGAVVNLDRLRIRAVASQQVASRIIEDADPSVRIKAKNRPEIEMAGQLQKIIPAGQEQLPSAALGYAAGGKTQVDYKDETGRQATTPFFEVLVTPSPEGTAFLRPGQTMTLRFETSPSPLFFQGWRALLQLLQNGYRT